METVAKRKLGMTLTLLGARKRGCWAVSDIDLNAKQKYGVLRSTGENDQKPRLTVINVAAANSGNWRNAA